MTEFDCDSLIVGAGAVGLATAYALARRGRSVIVAEKERRIGSGVSARNSEVIHAGMHYAPGSLKARLCVEGRRALYQFLADHNVAYDKCGKLIVATEDAEIPRIRALADQCRINAVEGMVEISGAEAKVLEPNVRAVMALLSPESGVFDSHGYMLALQGEIESHGGSVALDSPFESAKPIDGGFQVNAGGAEIATRELIISAGLGAQTCAAKIETYPLEKIPTLHFGKGNYFVLTGKAPFTRLIYPPPIPGALGVHYRRDLGGQALFGPDLQFVDVENYDVDPSRAEGFYAYVRRFWPDLPDGALTPDYAGIRPKLHGPGEKQPDFRIDGVEMHGIPNLIALFGIESPGLTSSLAIGEEVVHRLTANGYSPGRAP